jgi:hypothetical protein
MLLKNEAGPPCERCSRVDRRVKHYARLSGEPFFERAKAIRFAQKKAMMITKNLGMLLLAIYLILVGITTLVHVAIPAIVIGILALIAGILILIGR